MVRETLASLVGTWRQLGAETAVVQHRGNRTLRSSYGDLASLAGRFAAELARRGVQPGQRVVLWGENSPEWIGTFFGCLLQGVLAVPLDAAGSAAFAERVVRETEPALIVGDPGLLAQLEPGSQRLSFEQLHEALPREPQYEPHTALTEDTPFQIVFTSGTTSEPKGVVHTHRNVLASLRPIETEIGKYRRYERWIHPLRFLHTLPFSHVFGQFMALWIPALLGAEIHLPSTVESSRLMALIKRKRISVLVAVPRVLSLLRTHLQTRFPALQARLDQSRDITALKRWWRFRDVHRGFGWKFWACICGGATLPPDLESFWNGLGFALIQGYGMTETAALVTLNHPFKVGRGTLGKALPGREVRLSDEGEILVRGDVLAAGSWKNGAFQPRAEEWLATGDLATQDATGEIRFSGRRGDVIVTAAGMNVHPADVEGVLLRQPGVRGCVVVGCELEGGSEPVAVLLYAEQEAELSKIAVRANQELAPYQQVRRVLRWPEPDFPYTPTGKLLRRRVAGWACVQVAGGDTMADSGKQHDALVEVLRETLPELQGSFSDEERLTEDLHLDSLGRVQLQAALEKRFGRELHDDALNSVETLGGLRALVGGLAPLADGPSSPEHKGLTSSSAQSSPVRRERTPYATWPWSAPVRWIRAAFLEGVLVPLVGLLAHPRVSSRASLPDNTPLLLIANHVNTYDLPLVLYALPGKLRRRVATAMSAEVLEDLRRGRGQGGRLLNASGRLAYWLLLGLFNVFPLPRLSGFRDSFAHAGRALDRGGAVLIFPEGRRGWTGELQPFRPGIGLLVRASGVPVLPVALKGVGQASRSGGRWFRPHGLAVEIGKPLTFSSQDTPEEITRVLEDALRALKPS